MLPIISLIHDAKQFTLHNTKQVTTEKTTSTISTKNQTATNMTGMHDDDDDFTEPIRALIPYFTMILCDRILPHMCHNRCICPVKISNPKEKCNMSFYWFITVFSLKYYRLQNTEMQR